MKTAAALIVTALVSATLPVVAPAEAPRNTVSLDHGWRFK